MLTLFTVGRHYSALAGTAGETVPSGYKWNIAVEINPLAESTVQCGTVGSYSWGSIQATTRVQRSQPILGTHLGASRVPEVESWIAPKVSRGVKGALTTDYWSAISVA